MDSVVTEAASPRRLWAWAIFIALAGIAARALWYVQFKEDLPLRTGPDGNVYMAQAKAILNGAIANPDAAGLATVYREAFAPGYALFVAGLWQGVPRADVFRQADYVLLIVYAAQWLLAGLTTLMAFALSRRVLFGWSALVPPALLTLSIALIDMPNMFAFETLLMFLLTATVLLLVKSQDETQAPPPGGIRPDAPATGNTPALVTMLAGLTLSAAILVQPRVAILLPFAAWWLARAARKRYAVLFLIVTLVMPGAWLVRNYTQFDTVAPISINQQAALYMDNVDPVGGIGFVPGAAPPQCPREALLSPELERHFAWGRCMQRAGLSAIADHPADSLLAVPDRMAALFSLWNPAYARGAYSSDKWGYQDLVPASLREDSTYMSVEDVAAALLVAIYVLLMLAGLYALWLEAPATPARLIALTVLVLPLVHLVFHAENRFRLPVLPLITIALTLGAMFCWDAVLSRRRGN